MADVNAPDGPPESDGGADVSKKDAEISDLRAKLRALEAERSERSEELAAARAELERSEEERRALRSDAARVTELEVEAALLRRKRKLYASEAFAASAELRELKLAAEKLRRGKTVARIGKLELDAEGHMWELKVVAEELRRGKVVAEMRVQGLEGAMAWRGSEKRSAESQVAAKRAEIEALMAEIRDLSSKSEAEIGALKEELEEMKIKCSEIRKSKSETEVRVDELKGGSRAGSAGSARFSRLGSILVAAASTGTLAAALYLAYSKN